MDILSFIDIKSLGAIAPLVGYLLWDNISLKKDLREEREYSRSRDDKIQAMALKNIEVNSGLTDAVIRLKDSLQ